MEWHETTLHFSRLCQLVMTTLRKAATKLLQVCKAATIAFNANSCSLTLCFGCLHKDFRTPLVAHCKCSWHHFRMKPSWDRTFCKYLQATWCLVTNWRHIQKLKVWRKTRKTRNLSRFHQTRHLSRLRQNACREGNSWSSTRVQHLGAGCRVGADSQSFSYKVATSVIQNAALSHWRLVPLRNSENRFETNINARFSVIFWDIGRKQDMTWPGNDGTFDDAVYSLNLLNTKHYPISKPIEPLPARISRLWLRYTLNSKSHCNTSSSSMLTANRKPMISTEATTLQHENKHTNRKCPEGLTMKLPGAVAKAPKTVTPENAQRCPLTQVRGCPRGATPTIVKLPASTRNSSENAHVLGRERQATKTIKQNELRINS